MSKTRILITYSLYISGLFFITFLLIDSWHDIKGTIQSINFSALALSMTIMVFHTLVGCHLLSKLLNLNNIEISESKTRKIYYLSLMAKYIPGVIWGFSLQASLINKPKALHRVFLANIQHMLYMTGTFTLLCCSILFYSRSVIFSLCLIVCTYFFIHLMNHYFFSALQPRWVQRLFGHIVDDNKKPETTRINMGNISTFALCSFLLVSYLLALICITLAFYEMDLFQAFQLAIYQTLAWVVGIFTFIVPAGMGIREAVFLFLANFSPDIPQETIRSIAILTRFTQMLQDVLFSVSTLLFTRLLKVF